VEMVLRDYQEECVKRVVDAYKANPQDKQLLALPCASGKTVIFSHIIHSLAREHRLNAIVLCHLDELMDQAAEKYRTVKPDAIVGKVGSGLHQYGGEVTVAGVQTISRPHHLKSLNALYGTGSKLILVIDEAHLSAAPSYKRIQEALPDAFVLLVTATPYRLDGKAIIDKPPLFQKNILEMIQEGYLCDIKAIAIRTDVKLDEVKSMAGDFNERDLDSAINTPTRNKRIVDAYQEHAPGKRALAFCVTIAHAEALAYMFNDMGFAAAVVSGMTPLPERKRLYGAFERGEILVLTTVNVLSIGFDSPRAEVAIMGRPTQSQALYVQQAGRVLRLAPGKKCALLLDITDNSQRLRIMPKNFKRAIAPTAKDNESLLQAMEREEDEQADKEAAEKRAIIRKLNERRQEDKQVDLFGLPEWQERPCGLFVMEVGAMKHRIALVPCPSSGWAQLYDVQARLAPLFQGQKWLSAQPLDYAMQVAEKKARMLAESSKNMTLVDKSAAWRNQPVSETQEKFLKWKKIPVTEDMTKGQAADLIDKWKQDDAAKKQAKAERAAARAQRNEVAG
jgi:superfamily II DNA or RNA helicase